MTILESEPRTEQGLTFSPDFLWGAATAAYQVEGAAHADGRGPSIWDTFAHTPGKTHQGQTGDVACDHYHRFREDVALMRDMGLKSYRFSIAWPRIVPDGFGPANPKGLDFYSRLVDALLDAGIDPLPTLYHWDLPQPLEDAGGWPNIATAERFADYAALCFQALGDRIPRWVTLNEPWCSAHLGYISGEHAPGRKDLRAGLAAGHTLLVAHGLAVQRFRALCPEGAIGIVNILSPSHPETERPEDGAAARRWDAYSNRWFLDPIYRGDYPEEMRAMFGDALPEFTVAQRAAVQQKIDFVGVNYYRRSVMADNPEGDALRIRGGAPSDRPRTGMDWEIYPEGLTEALCWMRDTYDDPLLYVTENGAAFPDAPDADGRVEDEERRRYLEEHLRAAHAAIRRGARLEGYYAWSLMDNFEWACGYEQRFGLVSIDYATQKRTLKRSGLWYSEVIRRQGF